MACYVMYDEKRNPVGHMCGKLGKHCADCCDVGDNFCDYPVGKGKTCDRSICDYHSYEIAPNMHYCEQHHSEWLSFRESGGVKSELENVVPFRGA
jgi:hypothetical protein